MFLSQMLSLKNLNFQVWQLNLTNRQDEHNLISLSSRAYMYNACSSDKGSISVNRLETVYFCVPNWYRMICGTLSQTVSLAKLKFLTQIQCVLHSFPVQLSGPDICKVSLTMVRPWTDPLVWCQSCCASVWTRKVSISHPTIISWRKQNSRSVPQSTRWQM